MSGLEDQLRDALTDTTRGPRPPDEPIGWVQARVRRQRRNRVSGAAAALAVGGIAAAALVLPGSGDGPSESIVASPPPAAVATTAPSTGGPAAQCPGPSTNRIIDYVPFLALKGRQYLDEGPAPADAQTGAVVGVVQCRLVDSNGRSGVPRNGDAAFLTPGTEVLEAVGFDEAFRVLAQDPLDGKLHRFEISRPAAVGDTLFPGLGVHVRGLELLTRAHEPTVLGQVVTDRELVVAELLSKPTTHELARGTDLILSLQLDDGSTVQIGYAPSVGQTAYGQRLSAVAQMAITHGLR